MQPGRGVDRRDYAGNSSVAQSLADSGEAASADTTANRLTLIAGAVSSESDERHYQQLAARQSTALRLLAQCLEQPSLSACLTALVGELQQQFNCNRVVAGLAFNAEIRVAAVSQQSTIDRRSGEVQLLQSAMQEACDQQRVIQFSADSAATTGRREMFEAHSALAAGQRNMQLCSIPLCQHGVVVGALLFEKYSGEMWKPETIEQQKQLAVLSAQVITLRQQSEAGVVGRVRKLIDGKLSRLLAPRHLLVKLGTVVCLAMLVVATFLPVNHHVNAAADLMSTERRLITAPIVGYVSSIYVNVGDHVKAGQRLLSLDVRDLELQADKLRSAIQGAESEYRSAMASHDRKEMAVAQSQLDRVRAELDLVSSQIDRAQLVAPADGVIISGDLSQMIGAPVDRGETLLEMALVQEYKIQLMLNETDISYVEVGQRGQLSLKANPGNQIEFSVTGIHPVAVSAEGTTRFRLDAMPLKRTDDLLPGQTGLAKIRAGEASLLWLWTHRFLDWARLRWWGWFG